MTGRIDSTKNIFIYINSTQIKNLPTKTIEGLIIKEPQIKRQGTYEIFLDPEILGIITDEENVWGIKNDFHLKVFLGKESYMDLKEKGKAYSRKSTGGDEIFIYDNSQLDFAQKSNLEDIEFYIKNKNNISKKFE